MFFFKCKSKYKNGIQNIKSYSPLQQVYSNEKKEAYWANHVFLENGQCDRDLWVPLLLTVDDDDEVEFERILWELEPVDE